MLDKKQARELIEEYGSIVNEGRTIEELIRDNEIPRLRGKNIQIRKEKVNDSVFGENLKIEYFPLRLMYRTNRVSTHDTNRGTIPFKDQVLAVNHEFMRRLVGETLGDSQIDIPSLKPTSTVIPAFNLDMIMIENVFRMYMVESSTQTSLYQAWLEAKQNHSDTFNYAGRDFKASELSPNRRLPYLLDSPFTKSGVDETISPKEVVRRELCTEDEYKDTVERGSSAFNHVADYVSKRGLVLVDTKLEHGKLPSGILSIIPSRIVKEQVLGAGELFTLDSSTYWRLDDSGNIEIGEDRKPVSYSKEIMRGMKFNERGFLEPEDKIEAGVRYIMAIQNITREEFNPDLRQRDERIVESTNIILKYLT